MQKFDDSGNAIFSTPVSVVSDFIADKNVRAIDEIPGIGLFIAYDAESWMGSSVNIIGVDYDGNILSGWEDGLSVCDNSADQQFKGMVKTSDAFYIICENFHQLVGHYGSRVVAQ